MEIFLIIFFVGLMVIIIAPLSSSRQRSNSHISYHSSSHGVDYTGSEFSSGELSGCDSGGCDGGCGGGGD